MTKKVTTGAGQGADATTAATEPVSRPGSLSSKKLVILAALLLTGCSMSNEEIIAETKKCEAAGMEALMLARMWNYRIAAVRCVPKGEAQ